MKHLFLAAALAWVTSHGYAQKLFAAKIKNLYGYVDETGKWVLPELFDDAYAFSNGVARVQKSGLWSYVDEKGKMITNFRFYGAHDFEGDIARVKAKSGAGKVTVGLIDRSGKWVAMPVFGQIRRFADNRLAMPKSENGDWGFIDKQGKWMIEPEFSALKDFSDGLAMARVKGKWG